MLSERLREYIHEFRDSHLSDARLLQIKVGASIENPTDD